MRILVCAFYILAALTISGCSFKSKVLLFRKTLDSAGEKINSDLEKHVLTEPVSHLNVSYDPADKDAIMDVYYPETSDENYTSRPAIIWMHGGGWIAGDKGQIANYVKILATRGYTVVAINYSLAPENRHPRPVVQVNKAIGFLMKNQKQYRFNSKRIVIAGDSGGAQVAAESGIMIADPAFAKKLGIVPVVNVENISGLILYCGTYDFVRAKEDKEALVFNMLMRAYSGTKKFENDELFRLGSVIHYVPKNLPPVFISVGNNDILKKHSYDFASKLAETNIRVDSLFFEDNREESLGHEYQFNLDYESSKIALERTVKFLETLNGKKAL